MARAGPDTRADVTDERSDATLSTAAESQRRRGRRRWLWIALGVVVLAGLVDATWRAWSATWLREAYLPELEALVARRPRHGAALAVLGGRLAEAGEFAAAADRLEAAVLSGENDAAVWLTWAAARAASGDPAGAIEILTMGRRQSHLARPLGEALARVQAAGADAPPERVAQAISPQGIRLLLGPRTRGSLFNGLVEWWDRRHPERSGFATRERWARAAPDDPRAQRLWAQALVRNRRYAAAVEVLQRAVERWPDEPDLRLALADALMGAGLVARAGLEYIACLRRKPDWLPALLGLGRVALEKQLLPIAIDVHQRATRQAPDNPDAWIGLGRAYYNQRLNWSGSLAAFEKAAQLAPNRTDFYGDYANALRANFRYEEAEAVLRKRLRVAPDDARCHYLLALVLLDHRPTEARRAEAEAALRTSLRLEPEAPSVVAQLGKLLFQRGKLEEAVAALEHALDLEPHHVMAWMYLARACARLGRQREARHAQAMLERASAYAQQVAFLEDRVHRQPLNAEAHEALARLYESGGELAKAQRAREMAFMLRTRGEEAQRGVRALKTATSTTVPSELSRRDPPRTTGSR